MVKKGLLITIAGLMNLAGTAQKEIGSVFPEKWSTEIGVTTYRTNMVIHEGKVFIGSNGKDRNSKSDALDGVFELDAKTGKIIHQYKIPFVGDNDVNGVAVGNGKLFFGTDNYYFFCFDLKSKEELWKTPLPYDVESVPQLADLNGDGMLDVGFPVEQNEFYALNGVDGSILWKNDQLSCHGGNVSPLLFDVNQDGTLDFITSGRGNPNSDEVDGWKMKHYGDYNMALSGTDGKFLWMVETGAGVHASPYLYSHNGIHEFLFLDCYGEFTSISPSGKVLKKINFGYDNFSSPVVTKDNYLVIGQGAIQFAEKYFVCDSANPCYLNENAVFNNGGQKGRISATTMIADVLNFKKDQLISVTEEGTLIIMDTSGKLIQALKLKAGAEASVFVNDIDGDGKLELLIADLKGKITCYDTKSSAKAWKGSFK